MADIRSTIRTVRNLLSEGFQLGAYQRDYEWEAEQVEALFHDLRGRFSDRVGSRGTVEYFVGPFVTKEGNPPFLVDGQQRLTTLALLIAAIRHASTKPDRFGGLSQDEVEIAPKAKGKSKPTVRLTDPLLCDFKLAGARLPPFFADERRQRQILLLEANGSLGAEVSDDAARLLEAAFKSLLELIYANFEPNDLPALLTWVADSVVMADIRAGASHNDFTIFDTMNARGRPLDPLSQFLAFLGRGIADPDLREKAQSRFKEVQSGLTGLGKRQDVEFVKSWIASRCLTLPDATPEKGDVARDKLARSVMTEINSKTIKFAQENAQTRPELGLQDASQFVEQHWSVFGGHYIAIKKAYETFDPRLDSLWFLSRTKFESLLDYFDEVLMLSTCPPGSNRVRARIALAAQFLENIAARVAWRRVCEDSMPAAAHRERLKYLVARAAGAARSHDSLAELADTLARLQEQELGFDFDKGVAPRLIASNKYLVRALLARMTWYLDQLNGQETPLANYLLTLGSEKFDIEHLLPRPFTKGSGQGHRFQSEARYQTYRQRLGALVVLRSRINKEMSDRPYSAKLAHYANNEQNALQMTLRGQATLSSPMRKGLQPMGVNFPDATELSAQVIEDRERAMRYLAGNLWGADRLRQRAAELSALDAS